MCRTWDVRMVRTNKKNDKKNCHDKNDRDISYNVSHMHLLLVENGALTISNTQCKK
jgi:hypothetical protein